MTKEQLKSLIEAGDVNKIKDTFETVSLVNDISNLLDMYNIKGHDVMKPTKRKDKAIKNDKGEITDTVFVSRIPLPVQKNIVTLGAAFLGVPKLKSTVNDEIQKNLLSIVDKVLDDNKFEYKFRTCVKSTKSEKQSALLLYTEALEQNSEYWNGYSFNSKFRIRMKVISKSLGDDLYPVFDNSGDMLAFGRYYTYKELINRTEKTIQRFELYTADNIIFYSKEGRSAWEKNSYVNQIKKIPVIYFYQPLTDFEDVQLLIDRLEKKVSNHADTNDYYDSPIVKARGEVVGFSEKGETGKVLKMTEGADVEYLTYDSLPESMKMEMDNLLKFIGKFSHTPEITFESMKGMGDFSGIALKMLFMDAHLKAYDSEEIFGEGSQRLLNYIKHAISVLDPKYKPAVKLQIRPEFNYFLPKNTTEELGNVVSAYGAGIISLETAIKLNPLVEDAVSEMELIKKEADAKKVKAIKTNDAIEQ